jgi:hypothetical protein
MDERDRNLLVEIDKKVDQILVLIPTFVTWRRLGAGATTLAALAIAAVKLF